MANELKVGDDIPADCESLSRDARLALRIDVDKPDVPEHANTVGHATHQFSGSVRSARAGD